MSTYSTVLVLAGANEARLELATDGLERGRVRLTLDAAAGPFAEAVVELPRERAIELAFAILTAQPPAERPPTVAEALEQLEEEVTNAVQAVGDAVEHLRKLVGR